MYWHLPDNRRPIYSYIQERRINVIRLNADVEDELAKRLRHALVDEGITFAQWLRRQIGVYLAGKEKPVTRRKVCY